ncbi:MAG TPA: polyprenyl synthetase family protein, partial [Thermomicrobiaceae bacterium]|nr:polyprenyl synthetase family protein [Thermomicrobiaceae bacterium]
MERYIPSIEAAMREALDATEAATADLFADGDLSLYGMLRYHLGWANPDFSIADSDGGKRIRPLVCVLACLASGGDAEAAIPTAAAIELLHNFTLIHDDVQDRSLTRRHRRTVWSLYGEGQAINAGDAMFAISQLPLLGSSTGSPAIPAETVIKLSRAFNETVLRIVEGQVLDLGFEDRWDINAADYQRMIRGKTATLVSFAAWAGSTIAG